MDSLLTRLGKTFRVWLVQSQARARKKFQLGAIQRPAAPGIIRSGKRFDVRSRGFLVRAARRIGSRFNVAGTSRPKSCPYCRTPERVTRGPERQWLCRECGYEWSA